MRLIPSSSLSATCLSLCRILLHGSSGGNFEELPAALEVAAVAVDASGARLRQARGRRGGRLREAHIVRLPPNEHAAAGEDAAGHATAVGGRLRQARIRRPPQSEHAAAGEAAPVKHRPEEATDAEHAAGEVAVDDRPKRSQRRRACSGRVAATIEPSSMEEATDGEHAARRLPSTSGEARRRAHGAKRERR
jgi:hypothetical protein